MSDLPGMWEEADFIDTSEPHDFEAEERHEEHTIPCKLRNTDINLADHTYCKCWCHNGQ